eukprot:g26334.t1
MISLICRECGLRQKIAARASAYAKAELKFGRCLSYRGDIGMREKMSELLSLFPGMDFSMAYGSGVFPQHGHHPQEPGAMVDLVFAVSEPERWHEHNLESNPHHYSFLRLGGPSVLSKIQSMPAKIYYNAFVDILLPSGPQVTIKYGVISTTDLLTDLTTWETMYVAGRLHKPVLILQSLNPQLLQALQQNLTAAFACGLLLEAGQVSTQQSKKIFVSRQSLFHRIAGLSYLGDPRMAAAENQHKVRNIVSFNLDNFSKLYSDHLHVFPVQVEDDGFSLSPSPALLKELFLLLPSSLHKACFARAGALGHEPRTVEDLASELLAARAMVPTVEAAISDIVRPAATRQTLKGILTAGPVKALRYAAAKLSKAWQSR